MPRAPLAFPPEAVLTRADVARWLGIKPERVALLPIRRTRIGKRERYLGRWVLDYLERTAEER